MISDENVKNFSSAKVFFLSCFLMLHTSCSHFKYICAFCHVQGRGKGKPISSKKSPSGKQRLGQSPNISVVSTHSADEEFFTPTGTIEISLNETNKSNNGICADNDTSRDDFERFEAPTDLSSNVLTALSERRVTLDSATFMGIIQDLEVAQSAVR